jgi:hypothetical protein
MENRSWRVSAIVCVCAVLWCVFWSTAFWKSDATEPQTNQAHSPEMVQAQDSLREATLALTAAVRHAAEITEQRGTALEQSISRLERLAREVADKGQSAAGGPVNGGSVSTAAPQRLPEPGAIRKDASRRVHVEAMKQWEPEALRNSHLLWTPTMLAERYGAPDAVGASDGFSCWNYAIGKKTLTFNVIDGVVTSTYIQ